MIITLESLRDPKTVFCTINHFLITVGEDFIDQNESIVMPIPFIIWMQGKGYISSDLADKMIEEIDNIQDLLLGYETGLFPNNGECGNRACYKAYTLLSEYIASFEVFRQKLLDVMREVDLLELEDSYFETEQVLTDEIVENISGFFFNECSFSDGYDYFIKKRIDECDLD